VLMVLFLLVFQLGVVVPGLGFVQVLVQTDLDQSVSVSSIEKVRGEISILHGEAHFPVSRSRSRSIFE